MTKPIGFNGLARIAEDNFTTTQFAKDALATKVLALNPALTYSLYAKGAGPSTVTLQATSDTKEAIANGTAVYAGLKTYANLPAAGGFIGDVSGVTALRITHVKSGAAADDAAVVAALGGRFQVRASARGAAATGLGQQTPLTST